MSSIREGRERGTLFHYSNLSYWKDSAIGIDATTQFSPKRLSCRAMVEIFKSKGSATINFSMVHSSTSIENTLVKSSVEYIQEEYQRLDRGDFVGGFVDAYDIFAAGVVFICFGSRSSPSSRDNSIVNKCTAILTLLGERFVGLRVFRRVLWALSDAILGNPVSDSILWELPPIVPEGIRWIISKVI